MAKATYTKTTKWQKKKPKDSVKCNICGGKGYLAKGYNKKKK